MRSIQLSVACNVQRQTFKPSKVKSRSQTEKLFPTPQFLPTHKLPSAPVCESSNNERNDRAREKKELNYNRREFGKQIQHRRGHINLVGEWKKKQKECILCQRDNYIYVNQNKTSLCQSQQWPFYCFRDQAEMKLQRQHTSVAALSERKRGPPYAKAMLIHVKPWGCTLWASWSFPKKELTIFIGMTLPGGKAPALSRYGFPLDMSSHQKIKINTWKTTRIYLARCAESIFFCFFFLLFLQMSVRLYSCMHTKNARLGEQEGKRMEHSTTQWRKEIGREIQCQQYANVR